jgi:hypothetical protein
VFKFILFLGVVFGLQSCSLNDDDANFEFSYLPIVSVDVPESFIQNNVYTINVSYLRPDDCTYFQGFDVSALEETTRNVAVVGSTMIDKTCLETSEEVYTSFQFEVLYTSDYLFRFFTGIDENGDETFLEIYYPISFYSLQ